MRIMRLLCVPTVVVGAFLMFAGNALASTTASAATPTTLNTFGPALNGQVDGVCTAAGKYPAFRQMLKTQLGLKDCAAAVQSGKLKLSGRVNVTGPTVHVGIRPGTTAVVAFGKATGGCAPSYCRWLSYHGHRMLVQDGCGGQVVTQTTPPPPAKHTVITIYRTRVQYVPVAVVVPACVSSVTVNGNGNTVVVGGCGVAVNNGGSSKPPTAKYGTLKLVETVTGCKPATSFRYTIVTSSGRKIAGRVYRSKGFVVTRALVPGSYVLVVGGAKSRGFNVTSGSKIPFVVVAGQIVIVRATITGPGCVVTPPPPIVTTPPPVVVCTINGVGYTTVPSGYTNVNGICQVQTVSVNCPAGSVNVNGSCVAQGNQAALNCQQSALAYPGATVNFNSNTLTCTITQVNGTCSNIVVIIGGGSPTITQGGNCNNNPPPVVVTFSPTCSAVLTADKSNRVVSLTAGGTASNSSTPTGAGWTLTKNGVVVGTPSGLSTSFTFADQLTTYNWTAVVQWSAGSASCSGSIQTGAALPPLPGG